jgi:predicted AlkP superfamily pyrophosphatase or phosphodiesterase
MASAVGAAAPVTILVGIDGFRWDYLDRGVTPTLSRLAAEGVRARQMRPGFPSSTYPNFYTLVTGKRPDHNGVVANIMEDPDLPGRVFSMANRAEVMDGVWWQEAEPIWVTARRQGRASASIFWPGSESRIRGVRPDYWLPFEQSVSSAARVNLLLSWLGLPGAERPDFAALYFDIVDSNGHSGGPQSDLLSQALVEVDAAMGRLMDGLTARGLTANVIVVSDHGMTAISADRVLFLDDIVDVSAIQAMVAGAYAVITPKGPNAAAAEAALLQARPHLQCWRKADIPARLDYGRNPRVGPILCLADLGWQVAMRADFNPAYATGGAHGYDPGEPDMAGVFIANGPAFAKGMTLEQIDNVDVYPLLAALLGVTPQPNQGSLAATAAGLRR